MAAKWIVAVASTARTAASQAARSVKMMGTATAVCIDAAMRAAAPPIERVLFIMGF